VGTDVAERPGQLTHVFHPRGTAREAFSIRTPELMYAGPAGTGKSRALLERLYVMMLKYPGSKGLIVRKTLASLSTTALDTWQKFVIPEALLSGAVNYYGGSRREPAQYRFSNGSRVMLGGMDKPTKIMSSEYDVCYVQEAIELTVEDWESILTRLRNGVIPYQMLMGDTNPSTPQHWLKQRAGDGRLVMIDSRHEDNPVLFNLDGTLTERGTNYMANLDSLTGVRYLRLRKGLWVAAEGLIFEEFSEAVHVVAKFVPPRDWPRYWSVDFGFSNPFVLQCWARDPDGRLYLYRELYRTRRLVEDHVRDILELVAPVDWRMPGANDCHELNHLRCGHRVWREPRPQVIVCDHDAEDRATFEKHSGMGTTAANKSVAEGLQAVMSRLRLQEDGRPRLFIMRDAPAERDQLLRDRGRPTSTQEEFPGYVWARKSVSHTDREKDEPLKEDDHGMDTTRYIVMHFDGGLRPGIRWL
jgi:PBSX family phage terminase large subunit